MNHSSFRSYFQEQRMLHFAGPEGQNNIAHETDQAVQEEFVADPNNFLLNPEEQRAHFEKMQKQKQPEAPDPSAAAGSRLTVADEDVSNLAGRVNAPIIRNPRMRSGQGPDQGGGTENNNTNINGAGANAMSQTTVNINTAPQQRESTEVEDAAKVATMMLTYQTEMATVLRNNIAQNLNPAEARQRLTVRKMELRLQFAKELEDSVFTVTDPGPRSNVLVFHRRQGTESASSLLRANQTAVLRGNAEGTLPLSVQLACNKVVIEVSNGKAMSDAIKDANKTLAVQKAGFKLIDPPDGWIVPMVEKIQQGPTTLVGGGKLNA